MTSSIPAALTALAALAESAVTQADVYDGPPTGGNYGDWVAVGYDPAGGEIVSVDTDWASIGTRRQAEVYDVTCTAGSTSGDDDVPARRLRCYALVDALATALAGDYSLGGAVRVAHISSHSLFQERDETGLTVGVRFTVHCETHIGGAS